VNNILLNPGPTNTLECVKAAQTNSSDVCHRTEEFTELLVKTKKNLLNRFSPDASFEEWNVTIFGGSGTAAMESLISSLLSEATVIVAGKYGQRATDIMLLHGIKTKKIYCEIKEELEHTEDKLNLYFVENETTTGEKFDLGSISQLFPKSRLYVDATSAFGATDYTKHLKQIDAISFCSNKCLQSTPGLGIVIWRKHLEIFDRSYYLGLKNYVNTPLPFTPPVQSVAALDRALTASKTTEEQYNVRKDRIIEDFQKINIECVNKNPSNSIMGFRHPSKGYKQLKKMLKADKIIIYEGIPHIKNSFRISTMSVEFDKEYEYILRCFRNTAKEHEENKR
jgi:2-aminoethylphosphonate-pyruvate transaminase